MVQYLHDGNEVVHDLNPHLHLQTMLQNPGLCPEGEEGEGGRGGREGGEGREGGRGGERD